MNYDIIMTKQGHDVTFRFIVYDLNIFDDVILKGILTSHALCQLKINYDIILS